MARDAATPSSNNEQDCLDELMADLWARWGEVEPYDADARASWVASVCVVLRSAPQPILYPALWRLAERVAMTRWTTMSVGEAFLWLRKELFPPLILFQSQKEE